MKDEKIKEILLDPTTLNRKIFKKEQIEKLLKVENKTNDPYDFSGKKIWMILNLEVWMRTYIDQ
jgi:asparagine synthase (glutamine-hydrolysing)